MSDERLPAKDILRRFRYLKRATFYHYVKIGKIKAYPAERPYGIESRHYLFDPENVAAVLGIPVPPEPEIGTTEP